jgi:hypothetical protein
MFESDFEDMCAKLFSLVSMGAEQSVAHMLTETREQGGGAEMSKAKFKLCLSRVYANNSTIYPKYREDKNSESQK